MSNKIDIKCWNVNGIRAIWKKGFPEWFDKANPDILCLQETKAQEDQLDHEVVNFKDYNSYFFSAEKKGYSGVAVYTKLKPLRVTSGLSNALFDGEGRVLEMEFKDFVLYNVYFPNGGRGPERVKYKLDFYGELFNRANDKRKTHKNIIVCGDYNTAHKEIDLARPKENVKTSGFMPEERAWVDKIVSMDYIDIFREYNTNPEQYTYWDQITRARERNVGWRIDYYMISKEMRNMVSNATIHADIMGSDHCPIGLELSV
ncbi:MAG TPA: exodeoxyribonuclease III [Bacteroidia bacterium]|nr:exodeoxyribonuclease III [Bacteroidia bacterium]HNU34761.1 exodeoxyribonuclease III [Bacteroidia bacterium]